jgi:large subunit ribosomal protein L13
MKTTKMKKNSEVVHDWYVIDVSDKVLGRAASEIASLLKGKHKVDYTPHVDGGSGVIVVNCDKIRVTGRKSGQKVYKRFSGYPSGQKETVYEKMIGKDPTYVMRHAVKGMLPKNRLGTKMLKRLKLYTGTEHPHTAQAPKEKKI